MENKAARICRRVFMHMRGQCKVCDKSANTLIQADR